MFKFKYIISLVFLFTLCLKVNFVQAVYNPVLENILAQINEEIADFNTASRSQNINNQTTGECDPKDWTEFSRSFLSYQNFTGDWGDLKRNECLREDLWTLENKLQDLNHLGFEQALKCNPDLETLKKVYQNIQGHLIGLRTYGDKPELEAGDSQNCPNCHKAKVVGNTNLNTSYASSIYTEAGCELTQQQSKSWKEKWQELLQNMNLFKNIQAIWKEGVSNQSFNFDSNDYAAAQRQSTSWWDRTWRKFYKYNGRQLSFRHLRDDEDSFLDFTRIEEEIDLLNQSLSKLQEPPSVSDLVDTYTLQNDVYNALLTSEEIQTHQTDLVALQTELTYKYKIQNNATEDLENYLIQANNAIAGVVPTLRTYTQKLQKIATKHCTNLYGACN